MIDFELLSGAIAHLSAVATEDVPERVLLRELCDAAALALPVDGVGVMLTDDQYNRFVHATTHAAAELERVQEALRSGPCRDAAQAGHLVQAANAEQFAPWPQFAAVAQTVGIGSMAAVPLMSRGRPWGVLDLFAEREVPFDEDVLRAASMLASVATTYLVMAHDRDQARQAREQLLYDSTHDRLTGAANRVRLFDRLEHALQLASRRGTGVAVVFVDIDEFKHVNDVYGHRAGDLVLQEIAGRLAGMLRAGDTLGRLGGDELVLVFDEVAVDIAGEPVGSVRAILTRIQQTLAPVVAIDTGTIAVAVSLGAAVTSSGMTAQELIAEADAAMYQAKRDPSAAPAVRDYTGGRTRRDAHAREHALAEALQRDQLEVHYQPIVLASSPEALVAAEALMRWRDTDGNLHDAGDFVPTAVERGLMPSFGSWLVDQVCDQMSNWDTEFGSDAPRRVFINLSAREINDPAMPSTLAVALRRHNLTPDRLGLEIVEDSFAHLGLVTRLSMLRNRGHHLSIDDFGTGYSSLSRLFDLQVDVAKIDRSFVHGLPADSRRADFVAAVLLITSSLGISVVGEGVETTEQQDFLTLVGCSHLQGHLIGHPEPAATFTDRLRAHASTAAALTHGLTAWAPGDPIPAQTRQTLNPAPYRLEAVMRLCEQAADDLQLSSASVVGYTAPGPVLIASSSGDTGARLVESQILTGDGPLHDIRLDPKPIYADDLDGTPPQAWAGFSRDALQLGCHAVWCLPLTADQAFLGALQLSFDQPQSPSPTRNHLAVQHAADVIRALLEIQPAGPNADDSNTDKSGNMHPTEIYQAQGLMMNDLDLPADEALGRMRTYATDHDIGLLDLARQILDRTIDLRD